MVGRNSARFGPHSNFFRRPGARAVLISNQELYRVEDFGAFYSTSTRVNWPYAPSTILLSPAGTVAVHGDSEVIINPAFEEHIRNLQNWTPGKRFEDRFPELAKAIREDTMTKS